MIFTYKDTIHGLQKVIGEQKNFNCLIRRQFFFFQTKVPVVNLDLKDRTAWDAKLRAQKIIILLLIKLIVVKFCLILGKCRYFCPKIKVKQ